METVERELGPAYLQLPSSEFNPPSWLEATRESGPSGTPAPQPLKLLGVILLCSSTNHCLTASVNLQAPWKGYNFSTRPRGAPRKAKASALCTGTVDAPRAWGPAPDIAPESVACFQPPMGLWAPKQCGILSIPSPLTHKASTTFSGLHGRHLSLPENNRS